jgi:hypothetical protein
MVRHEVWQQGLTKNRRTNGSRADKAPVCAKQVMNVSDAHDHAMGLKGSDHVHGRVRRLKPHVMVNPQNPPHVRVDHATVACHDHPFSWMGREDAFDDVDHALAELRTRFRMWIDVPLPVAHHSGSNPEQRVFSQ